jgi:hypothetical protein
LSGRKKSFDKRKNIFYNAFNKGANSGTDALKNGRKREKVRRLKDLIPPSARYSPASRFAEQNFKQSRSPR